MKILEEKKVKIKPFKRNRPFFNETHDGTIRYTGCTSGYTLPWQNSTRSFVQIFKDGEQEAFEKILDLEPGTLNLYKRKGSWWSKFTIELTKEDIELDLMNPIQALEYRVLLADKASISKDKNTYNGTQDYYIEDETVEVEENYKLSELKEEGMDAFIKIRKSDKLMFNMLRVLGKNPPKTMANNSKALKAELTSIIDQVEKVTGQPNLSDFINTFNDKLYEDKIFVLDAIEIGEIEVIEGSYKLKESGQPVGRSIKETAEYFNAAKNQDDKLLIQQRIELNK